MGLGPSIKMTTLHHFRCPVTEALAKDEEVEFTGIIVDGVSDVFDDKVYAAKRVGDIAQCMRTDAAIVAIDGWGNHHVDFVNVIEQLGIRGIPSVGLSYIGQQGRLVCTNNYMDCIIDFNKSESGYESCVVGENNLTDYDAIELERKISKSIIRQKIYFYADSARIDFETYVDWKEHQHLLKVDFPVDIHTDEACFDIQFGNLTHKIHHNTSWDAARFESCGQKWMDLSEGHYGVSLLNDCKYGYSARDSVMSLTLIKSGIEPNPVTDQEEHYFTYSLYPHAGNLLDCDTVREGYKLNFKPYAAISGGAPDEDFFVGTDDKNIIIETVKAAEDGNGVIIRLWNVIF